MARRFVSAGMLAAVSWVGEARADVLHVGAAGFPSPQAAIDAAVDGDVILIQPGTYAGFTVTNKELFVAAADSATVVHVGASSVTGLVVGKTAALADLQFVSQSSAAALSLTTNAGAVRLQRCSLRSDPATGNPGVGAPGLDVRASTNVIAGDCSFVGGNGRGGAASSPSGGQPLGLSAPGGDGVTLTQARVALHRSTALGGSAGTATAWMVNGPTGQGGKGLGCAGSFLFSNGVSMTGGRGGGLSLSNAACTQSSNFQDMGRGGHGVSFASNLPSEAWFIAPQLNGGDYGPSNCPYTFEEQPGSSDFVRGPLGTILRRTGGASARQMSIPSLAPGTNPLATSFVGAAGELVHVVLSVAPEFLWTQNQAGLLGVSLASALPPQLVGIVDVGGTLSAPLALPALPVGATDAVWHVQSYFTSPAGAVRLGPSACVAQIP